MDMMSRIGSSAGGVAHEAFLFAHNFWANAEFASAASENDAGTLFRVRDARAAASASFDGAGSSR
jgi:hypothetical protein